MSNTKVNHQPDTLEKEIKFKLPYLRFYIGIALALIAGFIGNRLGLDAKESIALTSACIVATTLWYNALNLFYNYKVNERKVSLDKQIVAVNMITEWYKDFAPKSAVAREFIKTHYYKPENGDQNSWHQAANLVTSIDTNENLRESVIPILNYFEKIAIAVDAEVADKIIIKKYFKEIFTTYYQCFYPLIKSRQSGPTGLPEVFSYFCNLTVEYGAPIQRS